MALFNISFGQKVQLYACTVSLISLLFTGMTFVAFDLKENRQSLVESLQMKADLLGNASFVALSMGDLSKANDVISIVSTDPFIIGVWIYSKEDKLILTYDPQSLGFKILPESLRLEGVYFEKGIVSVVRNIQSSNHLQGKVMVMSAIDKIEYRAITEILILVIASVLSVITALLFSYRLRKSFTRPLHQLINTVETITKNKDYGIRSEKVGDHDLDMLTSSFNDMLQVIQERNQIISKNEERLNLALWGSNEIMFDWDLAKDNWYFDDSFESLFGYTRNEVPISKASYFKLIYDEDLALVEERLQKHLKGESPYFLEEHRIKHKSGNLLWVAVRSKVVERNMRGRAMRMAGTLMDITIRKQSEDRLKLYDKVFGTTTEGVMVTNQNFIIVEVNPAFSTITGYAREEILGQSIDMLHSDKHDDVFFRRMRFALQVKGFWQGELWEKTKKWRSLSTTINH
jgi:PAS domain S-box-containing protein